jgi:hypothetical protein
MQLNSNFKTLRKYIRINLELGKYARISIKNGKIRRKEHVENRLENYIKESEPEKASNRL